MTNTKILYVEDDESLAYLTKDNLEMKGYVVVHVSDGAEVFKVFKKQHFDICILDVMLPNVDGFQLARDIREISNLTPLIFLTARDMIEDRIEGLELGADDYMTKPFSIKELVLRIEAILRRSKQSSFSGQLIGDLIFDSNGYELKVRGVEYKLTARESDLLRMFTDNVNKTLKRSDILLKIWGSDDFFLGRSLDVFISRIRKILKQSEVVRIQNVHGVGFKMVMIK